MFFHQDNGGGGNMFPGGGELGRNKKKGLSRKAAGEELDWGQHAED